MLKNVTFTQTNLEEFANEIAYVEEPLRSEVIEYARVKNEYYSKIKPVRKGYYLVGLNANHDVIGLGNHYDVEGRYLRGEKGVPAETCYIQRLSNTTNFYRWKEPDVYGVADTLNQIYQHGIKVAKFWPASDFVCLITPMVKKDQPEKDGFRYHKWGEFIGKREVKKEYLYNDTEAPDQVYVFHFYALKTE